MKKERLSWRTSIKMNKHSFDAYLNKKLKDPEYRRGYEEEKRKLFLGYEIFLARERAGMTQGELAKRIGTRQSNISRLETGNYNFTIEMLEKIAAALKFKLQIKFIPSNMKKAA